MDEDGEFRDMMIKALEHNGFLQKMRVSFIYK